MGSSVDFDDDSSESEVESVIDELLMEESEVESVMEESEVESAIDEPIMED